MTNDVLQAADGGPTPATTEPAPALKTLPDLTDRQWRIFNFIRQTARQRGYAPSLREIGAAAGLASTSSVAHQITRLEEMGLIARDPGRPRAYRVVVGDLAQTIPVVRLVGCPLTDARSDGEAKADQAVVLQVTLDPGLRRALRAGALLTVQQLPVPDDTALPDTPVFGQVTAVTHPVGSPHP
ncbi:LexA family protein [Streptomyces variabilis]